MSGEVSTFEILYEGVFSALRTTLFVAEPASDAFVAISVARGCR